MSDPNSPEKPSEKPGEKKGEQKNASLDSGSHALLQIQDLKPVFGPTRVGRYELLGLIGTGGMAEVFLAKQDGPAGFRKTVVIKRILPNLAADPRMVEMFQREARVAAGLNHTNIVQVFELGEDHGQPFIVMEYVLGATLQRLHKMLRKAGRAMPVELAITAVSDAALGLHHAHTLVSEDGSPLGLVHRDISPDNLIVNREAVTKILDFGIAKGMRGVEATTSGDTKGKIPYMAPEQIQGDALDGRADLYALGVTLFWLLTGTRPFQDKNEFVLMQKVLTQPPPRPSSIHAGIPAPIEALILSLLEKDRNNRPKSADDVHAALVPFLPPRRELATLIHDVLAGRLPEVTLRVPRPARPPSAAGPDPTFDPTADNTHDDDDAPGVARDDEESPALAAPITQIGADLWSVTRTNPARAPHAPAASTSSPTPRSRTPLVVAAAAGVAIVVVASLSFASADASVPERAEDGTRPTAVAPAATQAAPTATPSPAPTTEPETAPPPAPADAEPRAEVRAETAPPRATAKLELVAPAHVVWIVGGKVVARGAAKIELPALPKKLVARDTTRDIDTDVLLASSRVDYARLPKGTLDIRAYPGARVFAGKTDLGEAPLKVDVVIGRHRLRLVNGTKERIEVAVVTSGKTTQVRARFADNER